MQLFASTKTIAPDTLISLISEEYECQKNQRNHDAGRKGKELDEAMSVGSLSSSYKGKGKKSWGKKDDHAHGTCWNVERRATFGSSARNQRVTLMRRRKVEVEAVAVIGRLDNHL